jgi:hypothetical protein
MRTEQQIALISRSTGLRTVRFGAIGVCCAFLGQIPPRFGESDVPGTRSVARKVAGGWSCAQNNRSPFSGGQPGVGGPDLGQLVFVAHFSARSRRDSADLLFQEHWRLTRG